MSFPYATPGVYIEEVTGPGVIAGVGTSTAAFVGPALRGPLNEARRITSLDEFMALYGTTLNGRPWPYLFDQGRPYFMAFAVEGFFTNGGSLAYIVRVGTAVQATLPILNQAGEPVFVVRALQDGTGGNAIQVQTEPYAAQAVARGSATTAAPAGATLTVSDPAKFRVGDSVTADGTSRAQINQIQGSNLILSGELTGAVDEGTVRIADILPTQDTIRLTSTAGLYVNAQALLSGPDATNPANTFTEPIAVLSVNAATGVVTLAATPARVHTYSLKEDLGIPAPTLTTVRVIARGEAKIISDMTGAIVTVDAATKFRPTDIVTVNRIDRAQITRISGSDLILDTPLNGAIKEATLRIADITPAQMRFRVSDLTDLFSGSVVILRGDDGDVAVPPGTQVEEYAVVDAVDGAGFVTVAPLPPRTKTYSLAADAAEPILIPQEFRLIVTPPPPAVGAAIPERFENLSLQPFHPRYVFNTGLITPSLVTIEMPAVPPVAPDFPAKLVAPSGPTALGTGPLGQPGQNDQPSGMTSVEYQAGLNVLRNVDDVNIVCIPDAAAHPERQTIQSAMINHCVDLWDRVAVLDSVLGAPPSGPGSVEEQRPQVESPNGFAALYYPWLMVRDPTSRGPQARTMFIPPSGHVAGIYARTDAQRGVHKAPANTDVRGVLGLERRLSDEQQAPLNPAGVNVLRIFPGAAQVVVWGARTTVNPIITDWVYVPIRRLLLFIEESIDEGIRWAVFEPNNLALWQKLRRTIVEFLNRVWRDGALFGATADEAFYVRIDEALNPASTQALGRLYIEIGVRPSYPAEFIIVRIGLWDGGAKISE